MRCVILQPSYVPWRGYFHQMQQADVFVFYDDVQYDKHGWRNRNRIKTPNGSIWLTIPVFSKGVTIEKTLIKDVRICWDYRWNAKHWNTIQQSYGKAPYFKEYAPMLENFYNRRPEMLADFTVEFAIAIARQLRIESTQFLRSSSLTISGENKTDRLLRILQQLGATHYLTGPSAREYLDEGRFRSAGIRVEYMSYDYRDYDQLYPPYDPNVSILDLLLMAGPEAHRHIWDS